MTAPRPQPHPGVLEIEPYVPGKSSAPGVARVFKLSSNETPLGPSPKAIAAYQAAAGHLRGLSRRRVERAARSDRPRLRPRSRRASSAAPAPTICCNLLAHAYLRRRRRGDLHHARLPRLSDRHARRRRHAGGGAGEELHGRRRRDPRRRRRRAPSSCSSPIPTIRPAPICRSTRCGGCTPGCRRTSCWCSMPPMPNMSAATITRPARTRRDRRKRRDVPHLLEDLRAGALRLGWLYGPAEMLDALNRIRAPFNVSSPAIAAGIAAIEDTEHVETSRAHNDKLAALADATKSASSASR